MPISRGGDIGEYARVVDVKDGRQETQEIQTFNLTD